MRRIAVLTLSAAFLLPNALARSPQPPFRDPWIKSYAGRFFIQMDDAAIRGHRLAVVVDGRLEVIDLLTHRTLWGVRISNESGGYAVAMDDRHVYTQRLDATLTARDFRTGAVRWSLPAKGYPGPMAVQDGMLLAERSDGKLSALDSWTGRTLWSVDLHRHPGTGEPRLGSGVAAPAVCHADSVFMVTRESEALRVQRRNGRVLWRARIPSADDESIPVGQVVQGDIVVIAVSDGGVRGLDASTGKQLWRYDQEFQIDRALATPEGDAVLILENGRIVCLQARDGRKLWGRTFAAGTEVINPPSSLAPATDDIVLMVGERLTGLGWDGRLLWQYDLHRLGRGGSVLSCPDGYVVYDSAQVIHLAKGRPTPLPTSDRGKQVMARRMVARFDQLTEWDMVFLRQLDDAAFEAVLPGARESLKTGQRDRRIDLLSDTFSPPRTRQFFDLLTLATDPFQRRNLLRTLVEKGRESDVVPFLIGILEEEAGGTNDPSISEIALDTVSRSRHPSAVEFISRALRDPQAPEDFRHAAFINLAATGGEAGATDVQAARDLERAWWEPWSVEGSKDDTDGDGWPDAWEIRCGTDPGQADTDGDGIPDALDRNPLAAPRPLSEEERVLAGVFEARFRFLGQNKTPAVVRLPEGVAPMEFTGYDGVVICLPAGTPDPTQDARYRGWAIVNFERPSSGGTGRGGLSVTADMPGPKPRALDQLISFDRPYKEAVLHIIVYFGPLAATGYDIRLRRIGDDWLPIGERMTWIS